jgi:hypothetical protein
MMTILIDSPVTAYSPVEKIDDWISDLKAMEASKERDKALDEAYENRLQSLKLAIRLKNAGVNHVAAD